MSRTALKVSLNIGIVTPVTLCMAITVLLVRVLNPEGASNSNTMRLATAYYDEKVGRHWMAVDRPSLYVRRFWPTVRGQASVALA